MISDIQEYEIAQKRETRKQQAIRLSVYGCLIVYTTAFWFAVLSPFV